VLEPGGEFRAVVPHFSNLHFYSDPTHRTFFGLYTFSYLSVRRPGLTAERARWRVRPRRVALSAAHIAGPVCHVVLKADTREQLLGRFSCSAAGRAGRA